MSQALETLAYVLFVAAAVVAGVGAACVVHGLREPRR